MKKIMSILLSLSIILSLSSPFLATENETDTSIEIIKADSIEEVFGLSRSSRSISNDVTISEVNYSYNFALRDNNPVLADVSLMFTMVINSQEYPVIVTGAVDAYQLSTGDVLWEGPLEGRLTIGEKEYKVLTGFSKLNQSPEIQISVTIQGTSAENAIDPIIFTFGEEVITSQIHQELLNNTNQATPEPQLEPRVIVPVIEPTPSAFVNKGYTYAGFDCALDISGYAQRSGVFFNATTIKMIILIQVIVPTQQQPRSDIERYMLIPVWFLVRHMSI